MKKLLTARALDRWVSVFKAAFKEATVDIHWGPVDAAAIARMSLKMPAIFISVLSTPSSLEVGDDTQDDQVIFSAFIVTGGQNRDLAGLNMSEAARALVPVTQSKIDGVGKATRVTWKGVFSGKLKTKTLALNAVAWRQVIRIGEQRDDTVMSTDGPAWPDNVVPKEIYVDFDGETELVQGSE